MLIMIILMLPIPGCVSIDYCSMDLANMADRWTISLVINLSLVICSPSKYLSFQASCRESVVVTTWRTTAGLPQIFRYAQAKFLAQIIRTGVELLLTCCGAHFSGHAFNSCLLFRNFTVHALVLPVYIPSAVLSQQTLPEFSLAVCRCMTGRFECATSLTWYT